MKLSDIAKYVVSKVDSTDVLLDEYVTTDCILQDKRGRTHATNLPPNPCKLIHYKRGDVLVANIRPYLKKVWFADMEGGASSDVLVFRASNGHSSKFLYATLIQDSFFDYVMQGAKGSKMPRGDKDQIMRYELPASSSSEESIGGFIFDIDKKISLNRAINQNLEAMAKQLYDYWFVQFNFPDKNGRPYKSSGGKMVWNEKLKRTIPERWNSGLFADIANITMGQSPDGSSYNEIGEGEIFYQGSTDFGIRFPSVRMYTTSPTRFAKQGDILMSVRAPVGAVNIANTDCCIGRGLSAINSKIGSITYIYYVVHYLKVRFDNLNSAGTTFGSITKDELFNLPVVVPPSEIVEQFEKICNPIFAKQMEIEFEIESLTKQRDELLPLLMNGQVSVNSDYIAPIRGQ